MPGRRARERWRCGVVLVLVLVIVIGVMALGGAAGATAAATPRLGSSGGRAGHGRVSVTHLRRAGLDGPSDLWIYHPDLPRGAVPPVLYFLHGHPGRPGDIFRAGLASLMDAYIAAGGTPFEIAAPDGNSSLHADTEWGDASDGSDEVESFLLRRVIPAVEGSHPRPAARRAIAGFSMGGYGAMNIALQHPELFDQVVSIAGYFTFDDPSRMFGTPAARAANSPTANIAAARGKRILLLEDRHDPLPLIRGESLAFKVLLAHSGFHSVRHTAPGGHDLGYVMRELGLVADFLGRGFARAPGG